MAETPLLSTLGRTILKERRESLLEELQTAEHSLDSAKERLATAIRNVDETKRLIAEIDKDLADLT